MKTTFFAIGILMMSGMFALAQQNVPPAGTPAHMVVTVEALHGAEVPILHREDVVVNPGKNRLPVTDWLPLQGEHAGLELFVLVDDSSSTQFGVYLNELRQFISSQSATTSIGIGYMLNGTVNIAQNLTKDHALAAKALRIPMGVIGISPSPYLSLSDLIKRWPASSERHEILMLTSGADRFGGSGPVDPYLDSAIEDAQRAGTIVYSIYTPAIGHWGHSLWRINWGQQYLAQLSEESGGEAYYFLSNAPPVTFAPYLKDLGERLGHQYLLTFLAKPEKKASFQSVKLRTEVPNAELMGAMKVYVPAAR